MPTIQTLSASEILDSRGKPTLKATCVLSSGAKASASVPSGASTGKAEARELRDGDLSRYRGLGCRKAAENVSARIASALCGREWDQGELDSALLRLDGTSTKSALGANAMLATSIAFARACAAEMKIPLHEQFAGIAAVRIRSLPRLTINLFSGGKHAGGQVPIQDILIVPRAATVDECLAQAWAIYQAAAELGKSRYNVRPLSADEGGLGPPFPSIEAMFEDAEESIRKAGFKPGCDVALAIDVASSHFFDGGTYVLGNMMTLDSLAMIDRVKSWVANWPIVSVEDALAEDDWSHWPALCEAIGDRALVLGDDFLCTNPARIQRAIDAKAANALLLKVNQIGTLTEAAEALNLARSAGWRVTISARSGETEDDWLADLAVGWGGDQIKVGSITQSERLAKYNRLLEIERETKLPVIDWP